MVLTDSKLHTGWETYENTCSNFNVYVFGQNTSKDQSVEYGRHNVEFGGMIYSICLMTVIVSLMPCKCSQRNVKIWPLTLLTKNKFQWCVHSSKQHDICDSWLEPDHAMQLLKCLASQCWNYVISGSGRYEGLRGRRPFPLAELFGGNPICAAISSAQTNQWLRPWVEQHH